MSFYKAFRRQWQVQLRYLPYLPNRRKEHYTSMTTAIQSSEYDGRTINKLRPPRVCTDQVCSSNIQIRVNTLKVLQLPEINFHYGRRASKRHAWLQSVRSRTLPTSQTPIIMKNLQRLEKPKGLRWREGTCTLHARARTWRGQTSRGNPCCPEWRESRPD